ncbi:MAG: histidinol-phosphatase [Atopobiaceae bacterium]|jgi:histidinol-phosphatase (PHP family)
MLRANFHTHTMLCDGDNTPEEMVEEALAEGFEQLGFSGHMDPDIHMDWPAYIERISGLKKRYADQLDIILGVELDNLFDRTCCPGAEYVIGSTHFLNLPTDEPLSVDSSPEAIVKICNDYFGGDWLLLTKSYYEFEAQVYDRLNCDFIGHFDLVTRFNDELHFVDETSPRYLEPALDAMDYLVSQDVMFEINCGAYNRGRKKELYPRPELLQHLSDMGGRIIINSDAHQTKRLSAGFDQAIKAALSCGFTETNVFCHADDGTLQLKQLALAELL